jgi:hypothetical protein
VTPLNIDYCLKDVRYECGSLVFTDVNGRETRVCTDALVDDSLKRLTGYWNGYDYSSSSESGYGNSTNTILAQIIAKVLGEFLQTPGGVRAIEKELNNYFNGTS